MTMDDDDKERLINVEASTNFIKDTIEEIKERLEKGDEKFHTINKEITDVQIELGAIKEGRKIIVGTASIIGGFFLYITAELVRFAFKKWGGS